MGPLSHRCTGSDGRQFGFWVRDPFKLESVGYALEQPSRNAGLGSFCNLAWRGKWRRGFSNFTGNQSTDSVGGLQGFQFFEAAVEGALDARLMTGEAVELGLDLVVVEQV